MLPEEEDLQILTDAAVEKPARQIHEDFLLAFDIGTTTVVCYLLGGETGEQIACAGMANPQSVYGGDVISRIRAAQEGNAGHLTGIFLCPAWGKKGKTRRKLWENPAVLVAMGRRV